MNESHLYITNKNFKLLKHLAVLVILNSILNMWMFKKNNIIYKETLERKRQLNNIEFILQHFSEKENLIYVYEKIYSWSTIYWT